MDGTFLGAVKDATFGFDSEGGYGLWVELTTQGGNVQDFIGIRREVRQDYLIKDVVDPTLRAKTLLANSRCKSWDKFKGTPVEVVIEKNTLVSWRVLTEVLL